jgi:hypothetical protein
VPNADQEQIGDYLYFFRSPDKDCSHCLIFGHAGWVPRLGDKFTIPSGLTLNFRSWHTSPNRSSPTREILDPRASSDWYDKAVQKAPKAARMLIDEHDKRTFRGGESCYNYVIVKGLGKHWNKKNPNDSSYTTVAKLVGLSARIGTPVHFVSIRNRCFLKAKKFQLLGDVINLVRAHEPQITEFMMAGCRGVHPDWTP